MAFRRLFTVFALCFALLGAAAGDPPHIDADGDFRAGMEFEFGPKELARFLRFFDFDKLERKTPSLRHRVPQAFIDGYLELNPQAFSALPPDLRARLTQGLAHFNVDLSVPDGKATPTEGLVDARGRKLEGQPRLALPREPAKPPGQRRAPALHENFQFTTSGSGLAVTPHALAQRDWAEVLKRWDALDIETRRSAIRFDFLPREELALCLFQPDFKRVLSNPGSGKVDLMRADAPREVRDLFGRLNWTFDGKALEFRHDKPVAPSQALADILALGSLAGVEKVFLSQSIHLHVSRKDGGSLRNAAPLLNLLKLVALDRAGFGMKAIGRDYGFSDTGAKGLVRLIGENQIEIRDFTDLPPAEFQKLFQWLRDPAALRAAASEALKGLKTELFDEAFRREPAAVFEILHAARHAGIEAKPWVERLDRLSGPALDFALEINDLKRAFGIPSVADEKLIRMIFINEAKERNATLTCRAVDRLAEMLRKTPPSNVRQIERYLRLYSLLDATPGSAGSLWRAQALIQVYADTPALRPFVEPRLEALWNETPFLRGPMLEYFQSSFWKELATTAAIEPGHRSRLPTWLEKLVFDGLSLNPHYSLRALQLIAQSGLGENLTPEEAHLVAVRSVALLRTWEPEVQKNALSALIEVNLKAAAKQTLFSVVARNPIDQTALVRAIQGAVADDLPRYSFRRALIRALRSQDELTRHQVRQVLERYTRLPNLFGERAKFAQEVLNEADSGASGCDLRRALREEYQGLVPPR